MKLILILFGFLLMASNVMAYKVKRVSFTSHGDQIVGDLYYPDKVAGKQKLPVIIVTGAWTTVKEQMPKTYAIELTRRGYAALTFDFRGWGESSGKIRYLEDPKRKTEDIVSAAEYLTSRHDIDNNRIGGLGICASSGYMADAYTKTKSLKSIALVAPWLHNKEIATKVYGGEKSVKGLLDLADEASTSYQKTGKTITAVAASKTDKSSIMYNVPYYTEKNRGLIKEYDNKFNIASWRGWLTYDAIESASRLPGKILFVGSESMALPQGAEIYAKIAGNKVEKIWLEKVTQFDFYDKKEPVTKAVDSVDKYFKKQMK